MVFGAPRIARGRVSSTHTNRVIAARTFHPDMAFLTPQVLLGTLLGVAVAWRRGSWLDNLLPAMTFFQAAPYFFVAILAVAVFSTKLGWFPPSQGYDTALLNPGFNWTFISNVLDHAVLPALTIVLASMAGWIIGMRNMMITTMDEDYVLLAQAKGLPRRKVIGYDAHVRHPAGGEVQRRDADDGQRRGVPTASNPYIDPVPNAPYMEYTLLHLTPAS
jgi:ABC-type antimicrobial peptide transport system permease subunit